MTTSTPEDLEQPKEVQSVQAQALELSKTQPVAMVKTVPGAHPVPVYAFSMQGPTYREVSPHYSALPQSKRLRLQPTVRCNWRIWAFSGLYLLRILHCSQMLPMEARNNLKPLSAQLGC